MRKIAATILVVDDQDELLIAAKMTLKRHFEKIITLKDPNKILNTLSEEEVDVVMLDMNYKVGYEDGKEGIYRLKQIKENFPGVKILLMTSYGHIHTAVEGIKLGAIDYVLKPWSNEALIETIRNAVYLRRKDLKPQQDSSISESFFKGKSAAILKVYHIAERVAKTDANMLILGENGTGKYVLAKHVHQCSQRKDRIFVHVDLGSLHQNLFESELFGYAKGAFTDAHKDTAGRFEQAHGGTIFLDEIGNIPLHLQSKLLQVIQDKSVIRLGESNKRPLDVRIITATNSDLQQMVDEGAFREDLYYRINTIAIELPPLRARQEDIPDMITYFLQYYADKYHVPDISIDPDALEALMSYSWRGNIRELQNRIERAVILTDNSSITLDELGLTALQTAAYVNLQEQTLTDVEKSKIAQSLTRNDGNISKTAEELGVSRQTLYRKIDKFKLKF